MSNKKTATASPWALNVYNHRIAVLIDLALEQGAALSDIVAGSAINEEQVSRQKLAISLLDQYAIMGNICRLFPDSSIGLQWGSRLGIACRDRAGLLMMCEATLGDAMKTLNAVLELLRLPHSSSIETRGNHSYYTLKFPSNWPTSHPLMSFHIDCVFASLLTTISQLLQRPVQAEQIFFQHAEPGYATAIRQTLGRNLVFNASEYAVVLPRELLQETLPCANATLARRLRIELGDEIRREGEETSLARRIDAILDSNIGIYPSSAIMARRLSLTERTLRRHLDIEQTSYHALIETVRFRHAQLLLARPELSVDAIALQLDFTDAANFRRAFKRWSGKTPAAWRQQN